MISHVWNRALRLALPVVAGLVLAAAAAMARYLKSPKRAISGGRCAGPSSN